MPNFKFISMLLILASSLLCGCSWARPRLDDDSISAAANEVIDQDATADDYGNNELMQQFAPVVGGAFYKQRRAYYAAAPPVAALPVAPHPAQLWRNSFLRHFYNMYPDLALASAGGGNYYSNEVLPLSTYNIVEPEIMY